MRRTNSGPIELKFSPEVYVDEIKVWWKYFYETFDSFWEISKNVDN